MNPVHCGASLSHHLHTICQNHHCSENAAGDREGNSRLATVIATVAVQLTFLASPHGFKSMLCYCTLTTTMYNISVHHLSYFLVPR